MSEYELAKYSRSRIDKVSDIIATNKDLPIEDIDDEYKQVVDNWRAAHAFPLDAISSELETALKLILKDEYPHYLITRRLKRLDSIVKKLQRGNHTSLYGMQDLGGCRIIAPTVEDVYNIVSIIKQELDINGHKVVKEYCAFWKRSINCFIRIKFQPRFIYRRISSQLLFH